MTVGTVPHQKAEGLLFTQEDINHTGSWRPREIVALLFEVVMETVGEAGVKSLGRREAEGLEAGEQSLRG